MPTAINPQGPSFQGSLQIESHPSFSNKAAYIGKCLFRVGSALVLSGTAVMTYAQIKSANQRGDLSSATTNLTNAETALRNMLAKCVSVGARLWRNQCVTPDDHNFGRAKDCPLVTANFDETHLEASNAPEKCGLNICDESDAFCGDLGNGLHLDMAYYKLNEAKQQVKAATEKSTTLNPEIYVSTALLAAGSALMVSGAVVKRVAAWQRANASTSEQHGQYV